MNKTIKFLSVLLVFPLAFEVLQVSGKPVYFVFSDILILYMLAIIAKQAIIGKGLLINERTRQLFILVTLSMLSLFIMGLIGSLKAGGEFVPLISSIKLFKTHVFFIIGIYFASQIDSHKLLKSLENSSLILVFILLFSDIVWGEFPVPRLGGLFFQYEIYGFPNSPAVFYTVIFAFIVNGLFYSRSKIKSTFYLIGLVVIVIYIVATLSRAGMLNLIMFMIIMMFLSQRGYKLIFTVVFIVISLLIILLLINYPDLLTGLQAKFAKFGEGQDASNGRFDIWIKAIELFSNSPIWGYLFEPFSNYDHHDTPHNQYVELLFKLGLLGSVLYLVPVMFSLIMITLKRKCSIDEQEKSLVNIYIAFTISALFTSNVQPNLSYIPTGVFIYFMSGFLLFKMYKYQINFSGLKK